MLAIYYVYYGLLVVSLIAMLTVLGLGFVALIKNQKNQENRSMRVVKLLQWRVRLAGWLIVLVLIGFGTGILSPGAPWDGDRFADATVLSISQ